MTAPGGLREAAEVFVVLWDLDGGLTVVWLYGALLLAWLFQMAILRSIKILNSDGLGGNGGILEGIRRPVQFFLALVLLRFCLNVVGVVRDFVWPHLPRQAALVFYHAMGVSAFALPRGALLVAGALVRRVEEKVRAILVGQIGRWQERVKGG